MTIPENFGHRDGPPIDNLDTILDDINKELGKDSNPAIEYLYVRSYIKFPLFLGYGCTFNLYGHAAIRYTTPEGKDIVVNIEGKQDGHIMVQIFDAKDYLYGTSTGSTDQDGYHRNIVGVRIENIDSKGIDQMHEYFMKLRERYKNKKVKFNIVFGPLINTVRNIFPSIPEYGNCAKWISEGLLRAGVVTNKSIWPKSIFIDMFENCEETSAKSKDNVSIVYYEQPKSFAIKDENGNALVSIESVSPLQIPRGFLYGDLRQFSNVVVRIPENSMHANVHTNPFPKQQSKFRNIVNSNPAITISIIGTSLLARRGWRKFGRVFWNKHKHEVYSKRDQIKQWWKNNVV